MRVMTVHCDSPMLVSTQLIARDLWQRPYVRLRFRTAFDEGVSIEFRDQASLRLFAGAVRTLATEAKHLDPKPIHWRPRTDRPTPALPTTAK